MVKKILEQYVFLVEDFRRRQFRPFRATYYIFFEIGLWATVLYRINRSLYLIDIPVIRAFIRIICFFIWKFSEVFLSVSIKPEADIGAGLLVHHHGLVRIGDSVKAGRHLNVFHSVTIGKRSSRSFHDCGIESYVGGTVIGDYVTVGAGAKVLGPVKIGCNVKIGANAVVISDVPNNASAVGVPARILEYPV